MTDHIEEAIADLDRAIDTSPNGMLCAFRAIARALIEIALRLRDQVGYTPEEEEPTSNG